MANLRTSNYKGFNYASGSSDGAGSGLFLYSGSMVLNPAGTFTSYSGVGMELVGHSESYLRFQSSTSTSPGVLDVRADSFYVGTPSTQFISGSGGSVEISSSNFHLTPAGNLIASNADFDGYAIARSLRQKTVTITQANMHQYLVQIIRSDTSDAIIGETQITYALTVTSRLVLDGSLGGEIVSHVIFDLDLTIEPPEDGSTFGSQEFVFCQAEGTTPTSTFKSISIELDGTFPAGLEDIDPTDTFFPYFGPLREIIAPPTTGDSKVPVTIEIAEGADVEFYIPVGPAAVNSGFGKMQSNMSAVQVAVNTNVGKIQGE